MAQPKNKRRRKRRGTQGGRVDSRRRGRPQNRAEARARAKSRSKKAPAARFDRPPTWRSAINRGLFAATLFVVLLVLIFDEPFGRAIAFGIFMLAFYIPMGYMIDRFFWRRRQAQAQARRQQAKGTKPHRARRYPGRG